MKSLIGKKVEYSETSRQGKRTRRRGVVVKEIPASLYDVDTKRAIPAVRFEIRLSSGRTVTTGAMAAGDEE